MKKTQRLVKLKSKIQSFKIEAEPLNEQQIRHFVEFYAKNGSFPGSKIPCTVTGKLTTCIGPWMKKKIKEFGGPENLLRNYKCRGALKAERQIIKPVKRRKTKTSVIKDENQEWVLPKIDFTPPRPLTSAEISESSKTQCFRPDVFLSNGRHCDGCEYFSHCNNDLKCMPKYSTSKKKA